MDHTTGTCCCVFAECCLAAPAHFRTRRKHSTSSVTGDVSLKCGYHSDETVVLGASKGVPEKIVFTPEGTVELSAATITTCSIPPFTESSEADLVSEFQDMVKLNLAYKPRVDPIVARDTDCLPCPDYFDTSYAETSPPTSEPEPMYNAPPLCSAMLAMKVVVAASP